MLFCIYTYFIYNKTILEYVWLYLLAFLLGKQNVSDKILNLIGLIYGILGAIILIVANSTSVFAGWDGNGISMIAFFSYAMFAATRFNAKSRKSMIILSIYSIVYFYGLDIFDSRSSILFSIILLLSSFNIIPIKRVLSSNILRLFLLFMPLIIAIIVVGIRNTDIIVQLNRWSITTFNKTIFNGRDEIWYYGFKIFKEHILFGNGDLAGNWHNSALTCLIGTGIVGYSVWIFSINYVYINIKSYLDDQYILGFATAFMMIWLQQSLELGLIQTRGQIVPFVVLGIMCARANTLRREYYELQVNNNSPSI